MIKIIKYFYKSMEVDYFWQLILPFLLPIFFGHNNKKKNYKKSSKIMTENEQKEVETYTCNHANLQVF